MLKKTAWFVKRGKLILASQSYSEHMPFERKGNFEWLWMQREPGRVELLLISWSAICIKVKIRNLGNVWIPGVGELEVAEGNRGGGQVAAVVAPERGL